MAAVTGRSFTESSPTGATPGKPIGLVLDVGGWYKNVITLAPSLEITHEEIDLGIALLDQLLTRAKRG